MKTGLLTIIFAILLMPICANAMVVDVNFYSDATIENGDVYGKVNIYDTPPDQTTVTMTGGDISYVNIYDTANLNCSGGEILLVTTYNNSKATINSDSGAGFDLYNNSQVHLYGGGFSNSALIYDNAELHIYGYYLEYIIAGPDWVEGFWQPNDLFFRIFIRNSPYGTLRNNIFLHEIPEPSTFSIMVLLALFARRRGDRFLSKVKRL